MNESDVKTGINESNTGYIEISENSGMYVPSGGSISYSYDGYGDKDMRYNIVCALVDSRYMNPLNVEDFIEDVDKIFKYIKLGK